MSPAPVSYSLDPQTSSFVIENYNWAKPFSNFLPGIAGKWGIPIWVYYVSCGQAITSVGVRDKNGQILEFQSFNLAVARVGREGFRTFLRFDDGAVYEPFRKTDDPAVHQTMVVSPAEIVLRERHQGLGFEIEVAYFPLPNLPVAALARQVRVRNLRKEARTLEWLDGTPRILPHGLDQDRLKNIARHIEGMMGVVSCEGVPIFRLKQTPDDLERVGEISGGTFYASAGASLGKGLVVDPEAIFGQPFPFDWPWVFADGGLAQVRKERQALENRTPSAFTARRDRLRPGGFCTLSSLIGSIRRDEELAPVLEALRRPSFLAEKRVENQRVIAEISDRCFTVSASPHFDAYAGQDFLDNVIRGGMPLTFDTARGKSAFYLYSRQNGDLERDYHFFVLEPSYLSQGTGHYRSILQNRRTDTWFFPEVEDANLKTFLNLIQLDGYNPLEVLGLTYLVEDGKGLDGWLEQNVRSATKRKALRAWMDKPFTPGELVLYLEALVPSLKKDREEALREVLAFCRENEVGGLHEGFWVDHWHYNVDLLEIYLMVYPDRLGQVLLEEREYTYFDDPDVILPRDQRSVDAGGGSVRSYGPVVRDAEKVKRIAARQEHPYTVRTRGGRGAIYRTNLLTKLLTIVVNRLATLDPGGTGIEMEAGKPGWNDSMNGLPGLFGSGLSETIELRRVIRLLSDCLAILTGGDGFQIKVYEELVELWRALLPVMRRRIKGRGAKAALRYWDEANSLKETYRATTRLGVSGRELPIDSAEIRELLAAGQALLDGIFVGADRDKVMSPGGVPYTYFVNDVTRSQATDTTSHQGLPLVKPLAFRQRPVRLFLEGPVHWMKDRPEEAAEVYRAVRRSPIYDRKLKMYKSCEDMTGESFELGRAVGAYPRGWIENESIYLHMEYKYLLEILRSGLCEEFWRDARTALMPFLDPAVYGRSTLEGASFIVSSAYADPRYHGRAFQPRLSGITVEFLHIWILAVAGAQPFRLGTEGDLELALEPRLPAWLFTEKASRRSYHDPERGWVEVEIPANAFAFKFLGQTLVVYHNPSRKPTWGTRGAKPTGAVIQSRDGMRLAIDGPVIPGDAAHAVRGGEVERIDVQLR